MREWMINRRLQLKLTGAQVAERADICTQYYDQLEHGRRGWGMKASLLMKLSKALELSVEEIYNHEEGYKKKHNGNEQ